MSQKIILKIHPYICKQLTNHSSVKFADQLSLRTHVPKGGPPCTGNRLIHGTKHKKANQPQSLKRPCRFSILQSVNVIQGRFMVTHPIQYSKRSFEERNVTGRWVNEGSVAIRTWYYSSFTWSTTCDLFSYFIIIDIIVKHRTKHWLTSNAG